MFRIPIGLLLSAALSFSGLAEPLPPCAVPPLSQGSPSETAGRADPAPLVVVSLNMHSETRWQTVAPRLEAQPELAQADIFLLQEFAQDDSDMLGKMSQALGLHSLFAANQDCGPGCRQGLALLSRYPFEDARVLLLPQNNLRYNNRCRIALAAQVRTPLGELKLFNLHLDTRVNAGRRVRQLEPVLAAARQSATPTLVGGDFNTADFLWIGSVLPLPWLQCQKRAVRSAMTENGFSTPFANTGATFKRFPLKLDWIFLKGLTAARHGVADPEFSDHRALWTVFEASLEGSGSGSEPDGG